jgi:AcrR family transcriptional regulator
MGEPQPALGLRDRKKLKTRDAIRREAMRLFGANGYPNTTIEQIAEAADIAPSTFFRYFPSKESVLMADDLDEVTVAALSRQPADMPSLQAFRRAIEITFTTVSDDSWRFERARIRMVLTIPELKIAQLEAYQRTVARLAEAESKRTGRDPNDLGPRVFMGALAGGLMAALEGPPDEIVQRMSRALEFIEAGMPL